MSIVILGVDLGKNACSVVGVDAGRLESPAKKMALVAGVFIVAPDVRMSILAVGSPTRPHTLTQTDQNTLKSCLQTGRAIRLRVIP